MNPQEQQVLDAFLQRLAAVHGVAKDPQADALIRDRLSQQPDAAYLLVQRALLLERALDTAHAQIAELQQNATRGDPGGAGFLNAGLEPGFGRAPTVPGPYGPGGQGSFGGSGGQGGGYGSYGAGPSAQAQAPAVYPAPPQAAPSWRDRLFGGGAPAAAAQAAPAVGGGGASFLGTAASAAAGVAGGMFLYNGIEHLMNDRHGSSAAAAGDGAGGASHTSNSLLADAPGPRDTPAAADTGSDRWADTGDRSGSGGSGSGGEQHAALDDGGSWPADDGGSGDFLGSDDDMLA